ncbi:hypothetical protein [Chryseobacterium turcicum]|uniref:Uncharacterized protein n=1 Tax=Chryseobacterium turcicum TaxID=2898076 RepID=A0A9Q3YW53_9FLAO|nr:hypothetical protein [Chryseobacterium turcicum]MCD1118181.1 hypothetical protein [Chryseobacterium turcicum]
MKNNLFLRDNHKFGAETFLSMFLSQYQFVLGSDLDTYSENERIFNDDNPCNIYFILQRPKITIDPQSFSSNGSRALFDFVIHNKEDKHRISLSIGLPKVESKIKLTTKYPFSQFELFDDKKTLLVAKSSLLYDQISLDKNITTDILDYEILYIGQAYGHLGNRTAFDRLPAHETLQKIYTHALTNNPDSDIWILLTKFSQLSMLYTGGVDEKIYSKENKKRDDKLIKDFSDNKGLVFTEKQKINFTEAALIKMFEPTYNKTFKNNFPYEKHSSYSECYSLDVRALKIELDTSEMVRNIYSQKRKRKNYHSEMFELKNDKDRMSLLGMCK